MSVMSPCTKDCPNRCPGCHDACEKYLDYKANLHQTKKWLRDQNYNLAGGSWTCSIKYKYDRSKAKTQKSAIRYYGN